MLSAEWRDKILNVPHADTLGACKICHGAISPTWDTCYKCGWIWSVQPGYHRIKVIMPCSVALGGSDWYRALLTYKTGNFPQYGELLATVLSDWLKAHGTRVSALLGRRPDVVTIVPSKKVPHPAPLWDVVNGITGLRPRLAPTLRHTGNTTTMTGRRDSILTDEFETIIDVDGKAVALIDDTWVSGQTAIGAALALASGGAESIALITVGRMVYPDAPTPEYEETSQPPYEPRWAK